jgi:hypothetical protein
MFEVRLACNAKRFSHIIGWKFVSRFRGTDCAAFYFRQRGCLAAWVLSIGVVLLAPCQSNATMVERKTLAELASGAELIFEGTVIASSTQPTPNGQAIQTCVTFNVVDVVAGSYSNPTLSLCFLGGELNGKTMVVSDMQYPAVGEHGIYLVESTTQLMVNPLIGWDQGRFLVVPDLSTGAAKMLTSAHHPMVGLGAVPVHGAEGIAAVSAGGAAPADVLSSEGPDLAGAMTAAEFKARLHALAGH